MSKVAFGVLCPSDIALRRFIPALQGMDSIIFVGVGCHSIEERFGDFPSENEETIMEIMNRHRVKAETIKHQFGGEIFSSYEKVVMSDEINSVYISLPPALHYKWAKKALLSGKHVLLEKPFTISKSETEELIQIAERKNLVIHENYMFTFHDQFKCVERIINSGEIGEVRLFRISFGFPRRDLSDFRYNKALGGGSLLDAGGYTIKCASVLLGNTPHVRYAQLNYHKDFEVDLYGSGALVDERGTTAQISFGMDNSYKCELEAWGSKGCLLVDRILTAPPNFTPIAYIKKGNSIEERSLPEDNAFKKSILHFSECIKDRVVRRNNALIIKRQALMMHEFMKKAL